MGLAPFFDKAAMAAAAVLRLADREELERVLNAHVVGVIFDDRAADTHEGRVALELSMNLVSRLYPKVAVVPLGNDPKNFRDDLENLGRRINRSIDLTLDLSSVTAGLVVGDSSPASSNAPRIHIGSSGWIVRVSSSAPVGCGDTANPFGAAAAACIGVGNVFRIVFGCSLADGRPDERVSFSLLDLDPSSPRPPNPTASPIRLSGPCLVGVGAIGNAAIWALSRAPFVHGMIRLIDHEAVDSTNPQRYVLATPENEGRAKVEIAKEELDRTAHLSAEAIPMEWGRYLASLSEPWDLDLVATALDSGADRIAVQAALPRRVLNAWTQVGDIGVSRHDFLGDFACLACMYLPNERMKSEDQVVAEALRLPQLLKRVRELLYTGEPVGAELVTQIASAHGLSSDALDAYSDKPLRAFYAEAVCGGLLVRLGSREAPVPNVEVPLAFQSAMAGVLLAAALVGEAGSLPLPKGTKAVLDLLKPLGDCLTVPVRKHASDRCLCKDPDFQAVFATRNLPKSP